MLSKKQGSFAFTNQTFALEDLAQEWSTYICSFLIIIIGAILLLHEANNDFNLLFLLGCYWLENIKIYVIFSGLIGLLLTRTISLTYQNKVYELEEFSKKYIDLYLYLYLLGNVKIITIFALSLLIKKGLYQFRSLLLQDYLFIINYSCKTNSKKQYIIKAF